jgi:alginate O-acetyltransferase complex protein AlgI
VIFTELRFLPFFALVFGVHWALRGARARKLWLLAASYTFYAAWDWRFLSLLLLSSAIAFGVGQRLHAAASERARRRWLAFDVAANLAILGTFKYCDFFLESAQQFLAALGLPASPHTLGLILPIGISFYTFHALSYALDVGRRTIAPADSFLDVALYLAFFPQLVAGPIVRASHFLPQLASPRRFAAVPVRACLVLFLAGFVKKAVLSDGVAPFVDHFFADPAAWSPLGAWTAVLGYAVQIYCDFSGYTDMAIACAGLLGYELPVNFRFPYLASNPAEFWRRWHVSLSSWLRDYLYIPLGGSRGSRAATWRNLMLTMLLGGLWHGAAWRFALWGGLHGLALIAHREWRRLAPPAPASLTPALRLLAVAATFASVSLAWIPFRAPDLATAGIALRACVLFESAGARSPGAVGLLAFAALASLHVWAYRGGPAHLLERLPATAFAPAYGAACALALAFVQARPAPFIYFQF